MNNLINTILLTARKTLCLVLFLGSFVLFAQIENPANSTTYSISEISVSGETVYSAETIITYSGLKKGDEVIIPGGTKISEAIKKLWNSNLFSDIDVFITKIEGAEASLEIKLNDLPELKSVKILGV